jgi:hypothetical protein
MTVRTIFATPAASPLCFRPGRRLSRLDWGVLLLLIYEIPSLLLSRYPANGAWANKALCLGALVYFVVRLVLHTAGQVLIVALVLGTAGSALAWRALTQFNGQVRLLRGNGLLETMAFRARLIAPPPPWLLGEWFTLVLLTLTFAFAVPVFFWVSRQWISAAVAAPMALVIGAALLLSCSRSVVGGVIVLVVVVVVLAAVCRVVRRKTAAIFAAGAVCVLGLVLVAENAVFPTRVQISCLTTVSTLRTLGIARL